MSVNHFIASLGAAAPEFLVQLVLFERLFLNCFASDMSHRFRFSSHVIFGGRV